MVDSAHLFEAIAVNDCERLPQFFARAAVHALHSYQTHCAARDVSREEKTDDPFVHHLLTTSSSSFSDSSTASPSTISPSCLRRSSSKKGYTELLRQFSLFLHHPDSVTEGPSRSPALYAERLVRDAVKSASEARPPANFVLYADGTMNNNDNNTTNTPIFDGSVANTTPGGGMGTALHAATALDRPLVLALLLAMGADGRACHTAFRRLMVHEAACNGSKACLTLLLEMGKECGQELKKKMDTCEQQPQQKRPLTSSSFIRPSSWKSTSCFHKNQESVVETLSLLRLFRGLASSVQKGDMTELEAARRFLNTATLSEATKISLAKQGGFFDDDDQVRTLFRPIFTNHSSSDGHGNTPLHWAAFKNETGCVSLLIRFGANPNARAHPSGWTPLHDAAYSNGRDSIALLIDAGANVDARANSGATPLCFAAQENAAAAAELLLIRGADVTQRCCSTHLPSPSSRFSGYTPLHYCAHYNAEGAAMMLLQHHTARAAMEVRDLNDRLPIHVAVARGSSAVLRELLKAGARVETRTRPMIRTPPQAASTSPLLRSMIPAQPVQSSKPWNCLSQRSIDECRQLMSEVEQNWTPNRHSLFTPSDRLAVAELLRVGKRLEMNGSVQFTHLWPEVLSFCGRGWFEVDRDETETEVDLLLADVSLALPSFC